MANNSNPRDLAVTALSKIKNGAYSNLQLNQIIEKNNLSEADRHLLTNIVYGVIQHRMTLEYQLTPFINPKKTEPWLMELLYTALYQMNYLDRIPTRAIFDETIEIAKQRGHEGNRRFVTGVLHQIQRTGLKDPEQISDRLERLSMVYSMPIWIIEMLDAQVGENKTESILKSVNQPANQSVRVNRAVTTIDQAIEQLEIEGYEVQRSEVAEDGLILSGQPANRSALFSHGMITIQDESAMLPAETMQLKPDMEVLDACAAPGGKTTQIAAYLKAAERGQVVALDIHKNKINLINKNAQRMQVTDEVVAQDLDARKVGDVFEDELFNRILVDAPCSGIGLIRRKPEIRYEKSPDDINNLQRIQGEILNAVTPKLQKNGILVYSTCTIFKQENDDVVANFLANHPDFELVKAQTQHDLHQATDKKMIQLFPDDFDSDGFFIATMQKKA